MSGQTYEDKLLENQADENSHQITLRLRIYFYAGQGPAQELLGFGNLLNRTDDSPL